MRYYIIRSYGPRRFGPYQIRRSADHEVVDYASHAQEAHEKVNDLEARDRTVEDLPPLVVHRHVAAPVADRLSPRPWRPE